MLQLIYGDLMYVVDFDTMPVLPITGAGWDKVYADALTEAFERGIITEPGKYGIYLDAEAVLPPRWTVVKLVK